MIIAIIILSTLLLGAIAFIFWLLQVLKNTFQIIGEAIEITHGKTALKYKTAYDGKYYPATVIAQIKFNCDQESVIVDFSMYDTKKIVGFIICTKESIQEYVGSIANNLSQEVLEETFAQPTIFKHALVYAPTEGTWTWKLQQEY